MSHTTFNNKQTSGKEWIYSCNCKTQIHLCSDLRVANVVYSNQFKANKQSK